MVDGIGSAGIAVELLDVELIGLNAENLRKVLFTLALVIFVYSLRWLGLLLVRRFVTHRPNRSGVWTRQGIQLAAVGLLALGLISIWVNPGSDLTTGIGLITAGLAFALQQLITAFAAYFVILRGDTFNVGDRITLGGVRGDVIRLGFIKTTIMEMGQPPSVASADPAVWVNSRQYTGRLVTVSNGKIFEEPVYNYSRDFPYLWEEIVIPITYEADRGRVEHILLEAASMYAISEADMDPEALEHMKDRDAIRSIDIEPSTSNRRCTFISRTTGWNWRFGSSCQRLDPRYQRRHESPDPRGA